MNINDFLSSPLEAGGGSGPEDQIVLSSRVRLARNVEGFAFPGWAKKPERVRSFENIQPAVQDVELFHGGFSAAMEELSAQDKQILVERHLISREHANKGAGSGIVLARDQELGVMINEEDHLRMQAIKPGFQIEEAWKAVNELDTQLESRLPYAFSKTLGYLTACPTNLGTGIRVSAMLHLPGLVLADQINGTINAVTKLNHAVRGLYGEGTDASGNIFQVSNQMTLGESEEEIVVRLSKVLRQIITNERNARRKLLEDDPKMVYNHIGRAYGILSNAHRISSKEAMNQLSMVTLGVELDLFEGLSRSHVNELFLKGQPAHLQQSSPEKLSSDQRDILRADMLREGFAEIPRPRPS